MLLVVIYNYKNSKLVAYADDTGIIVTYTSCKDFKLT